ncbi:conserved hypothetical protein [Acinetobacter proteolyticus]|uniref:Uncharacterized protein n=1 Tax=Acinetobacter proteolyticus TaxID=1776741 RepID=A0A653K4T3_9GAMM|nr:conserved hypothetical protein [Acinetobacter proteolyticus]
MLDWLREWWKGKEIEFKSSQGDSVFFVDSVYKRHWTSKLAHTFVKFYLEHWKFIWGSIVAIFCASLKFL